MIDISKYEEVIRFIRTYNESINSNRKYYNEELNRHPADFIKIGNESEREDDMALDLCLTPLKNLFPNVVFTKHDIESLSQCYVNKEENYKIITSTKFAIDSHRYYGGRSVSEQEIEKMKEAESKKAQLEKQYNDTYASFFEICEKLNDSEALENPDYDIEEEIFNKIYEQGFKLRPKNTILKKYYETYKTSRDKAEENEILTEKNSELSEKVEQTIEENKQLRNDNDKLKNDNSELIQKNSKLQRMLTKTLEFCNYVRESRFGKFFFRKKIKELPEPQSIDEEER